VPRNPAKELHKDARNRKEFTEDTKEAAKGLWNREAKKKTANEIQGGLARGGGR